ncbi:MAG TPA: LLM class flavin-dependent oxidoreductase [Candidatus Sulfotelmatobacter sp.]|nr:LLM class flavin-dependent oxidoreductase [Candidatus Sulfotelmatobacter sp.]
MMKYGLSFLPDVSPDIKAPLAYYRDALALCEMADQSGLETVKITEHYMNPYGGYCPDPLMFLTAVAMRTKRVRLMTGGVVAAWHHPIRLASRLAMLDVMSKGRLDVGFVRAFLPYEFDAFGIPMDESRSRYELTIRAVDRLLAEEKVTEETPYFNFNEVSILPPAFQTPRPPIWCAAAVSEESFRWAGAQGYDLMVAFSYHPIDTLAAKIALFRNENPTGRVTVFVPLVIDKNHARAVERGSYYLKRYHSVWAEAADSWKDRESTQYLPAYAQLSDFLRSADYSYMNGVGSVFFGDPKFVIERTRWLIEELRPYQLLWNLDIGGMPFAIAGNTLQLFVEHVLPEVAGLAADGSEDLRLVGQTG